MGALGRRFESCRPDSIKASQTSELPRLAFLLHLLVGSWWPTNLNKDKEKEDIKNEMELKQKEEVKKEVDLKST